MAVASLKIWRPGAYARDSLRVFGWLILRAAAQAVYVLLLARWLGAEGYGAFVAALAVASFFTPLAGLGLGGVLLTRGAANPAALPWLQARAMRIWLSASAVCVVLATLAMLWSVPRAAPGWALAALAVAEVAVSAWVELQARIAQAHLQAQRFGALQAGLPLVRLLVLVPTLALAPATPAAWMLAYAAASLLYAALLALRHAGKAMPTAEPSGQSTSASLVRAGLPFAFGALSARLQAEFNKPVLAQAGYMEVGVLSVAQRILDLASLPLIALQEALWPRVFAAEKPQQRLIGTGALLIVLALGAGGALMLAAPLLPWLLGTDFAPAAKALMWLALLPALQLARNLSNAWLMAHGHSQALYLVYGAAAVSGILFALVLVPRYALTGAVVAMYASETVAMITAFASSPRRKAYRGG